MSTTVIRTTTDKLEAVIAEQENEDRILLSSQFTGGRDWVLFFSQMITLESTVAEIRPTIPPLDRLRFAGTEIQPELVSRLLAAADIITQDGWPSDRQRGYFSRLLWDAGAALGFYLGEIDGAPYWPTVTPAE